MSANPPPPKRRRLLEETGGSAASSSIRRDDAEIRSSLTKQHADLERFADVSVCTQGERSSEAFACVAALLASASRPLSVMLFGQMRAIVPACGETLPVLRLRETEPRHFALLLRFIHGNDIPLEIDEAFEMHAVADFYEVLGLRDACCRYLLESLRAANCCSLLARARGVHCEPLVGRCLDTLTLDFMAVVEHDPTFCDLEASALRDVISRDALVCADEYEVLEGLVTWYAKWPTDDKYAALAELLHLVRWRLVGEPRRADVHALAEKLRAPGAPARAGAAASPERDAASLRDAAATPLLRDDEAGSAEPGSNEAEPPAGGARPAADGAAGEGSGGAGSSGGAGGYAEHVDAADLARSLFEEGQRAVGTATPPPLPRQYCWGQLVSRNPPPVGNANAPEGAPTHTYRLVSTKEYTIGRSRKSDIRIGHNAPMPYISSQHFRVFHLVRWPADAASDKGAAADGGGGGAAEEDEGQPVLQAWLEDLSQNGTFINGVLVGRNKQQALADNDKIEMVFPQGRHPPQHQNQNAFPIFTYVGWRNLAPTRAASPIELDADAADGETLGAAGQAVVVVEAADAAAADAGAADAAAADAVAGGGGAAA